MFLKVFHGSLAFHPWRFLFAMTRGMAAMLLVLAGLLGVSPPISADDGKIVNPWTRALVETRNEVMIGGFIIEEGARQVLIQAIGPELATNAGITNALADPVLTVTNTTDPGNPIEIMVNDNWEDSQRQLVTDLWGSSPNLTAGSLSAAAVLTLEPGNYTAKVEGKNGATGVTMIEMYGIDSVGANGKIINLSTRALVETGNEVMIGGFIIEEGARQVLIQAIGPELATNAGISNALADPVLTVTNTTDPGNPIELMVNDNWEDSQGQLVSDLWGGNPNLTAGSLSAAVVLTLEPGNYIAKVEGKDGTVGVAMVEMYGINSPDADTLRFTGTPSTQHLDLPRGAQSGQLPVPLSWSAAIPIESDIKSADLIGLNGFVGGSYGKISQPGMKGTVPRPNIVIILSDDMGWGQPGFNGGTEVATPNMDRIANEGVKLTQFYVHPVCTATRGALLTGRYDWKNGTAVRVGIRSKFGMLTDERTIAEALGDAGYATSIVGKWHLGQWQKAHLPLQRGFDHHYGLYGGEINSFSHHRGRTQDRTLDWHRNERPVVETGYSTFLLAEEAVQLIERHDGANPFFLYLPFNAVHNPNDAPQEYIDLYDHLAGSKQRAQLKAMDIAIGRILDALERKGVLNDTLVMFLNDNGGVSSAGWNAPYRGKKSEYHEGGTLVPAVLRWPEEITAGSSSDALLHVVDLFPTFAGLAGASTSGGQPLDGVDAWDAIANGAESPRGEVLHSLKVIRRGNWKLIEKDIDYYGFTTDEPELYNLAEDPYEETNLASSEPEKIAELRRRLAYHADFARDGEANENIPNHPPTVYGEEENTAFAAAVEKAVRARNAGNLGPGLVRIETVGDQVKLSYDEVLDAGSVPPASAFTLVINPGYRSAVVNEVAVSGHAILLTLGESPATGETVGLTYEVPDTGAVRDGDGLEANGVTWVKAAVTSAFLSGDASLSSLSLSGIDIGTFSSTVTSYSADVGFGVATTTVTVTGSHSGATVSIEPGAQVSLAEGANEITITVTAEDGLTTRTYTVTVTRVALPVVSIKAVSSPVSEGERAKFRMKRTGVLTESLNVNFLAGDHSLIANFPPGKRSKLWSHLDSDDEVVEDDVRLTWTIMEGDSYTVSPTEASATVIIEDDDVPEFALSIEPAEIAENESATIEVQVNNGVTFAADQTIEFDFSGSTATKDTDFTVSPVSPILEAGQQRTTATVAAMWDSDMENNETVSVAASHDGQAIGTASLIIENATVTPLTAQFLDMPATHDGGNTFEFELRFNTELPLSLRTLRDDAFEVTGGTILRARRLVKGSNLRWSIRVQPSGDMDVVVVLPATTDCGATGALCTESRNALSNRLSATVVAGTQ